MTTRQPDAAPVRCGIRRALAVALAVAAWPGAPVRAAYLGPDSHAPARSQLATPNSQLATSPSLLAPEFDLIAAGLADLASGREEDAKRRAAASPELARRAFEELLAEAVVARVQSGAAAEPERLRLLEVLATAGGDPAAAPLLAKLPAAAKGANPFDETAGGLEGALARFSAIEQVKDPATPAGVVEQRTRAEAALAAARSAGSRVLAYTTLGVLGLYAFQGGDVAAARRYWAEGLEAAEPTGHPYALLVLHRSLGLAHARERRAQDALRELSAAERILASGAIPPSRLAGVAPPLYADIVEINIQAGDLPSAVEAAEKAVAFLEAAAAAPGARAEALERLAQLRARGASASQEDARAGADALARAADARAASGERALAVIDLAGAGVLLVENAGGAEARPLFERARALAAGQNDRGSEAGLTYWLARSYAAEAAASETAPAAKLHAEALRLYAEAAAQTDALARAGAKAEDLARLRTAIAFWTGRAHLAGPAPRPALAAAQFRRAFDAAIAVPDVNEAVTYAEWELRARAAAGDAAATALAAGQLFDALAAPKRLDPLRAADTLAAPLAEPPGRGPLPPALVALYDRAAAALVARKTGSPELARTAVVRLAAAWRDRATLAARGAKAFDELTAALLEPEAAGLAEAVAAAWAEIGDATEAARWRARAEPLARAFYEAASKAGKFEEAAREADRLAALAREGGDAARGASWAAEATAARAAFAEALEKEGKLGSAAQQARVVAKALEDSGDAGGAAGWYARAAGLAAKINDPEARAEALVGRSRAELARGQTVAAIASATEAVRIAAGGPDRPWNAPDFRHPLVAVRALAALGTAIDADPAAAFDPLADPAALPEEARGATSTRNELGAAAGSAKALYVLKLAAELAEASRPVLVVSGEEPSPGAFAIEGHRALVRALVRRGLMDAAIAVAARGVAQIRADELKVEDARPAERAALGRALAARRALFVADAEARAADPDRRPEALRRLEAARAAYGRALDALAAASPELAARAGAKPAKLTKLEPPFAP